MLIKPKSQEEFVKAVRYFEYLGAKNEDGVDESSYALYPIVVVESTGKINAWAAHACPYERYAEISIPDDFLNKKVYTREEAMKEFDCIIV